MRSGASPVLTWTQRHCQVDLSYFLETERVWVKRDERLSQDRGFVEEGVPPSSLTWPWCVDGRRRPERTLPAEDEGWDTF